MLSKIVLSCTFRNLRVDPVNFDLLGLRWKDNSCLDISIHMGMKSGSALCQCTNDIIRHIMALKTIKVYIDDVIMLTQSLAFLLGFRAPWYPNESHESVSP